MSFSTIADSMLGFALGNLAIALPLGLIAWCLQRRGSFPFLAHLIWLVVLVKLVTPPLYSLSLPTLSEVAPLEMSSLYVPTDVVAPASAADRGAPGVLERILVAVDWKLAAMLVWLAGSMLILGGSLLRALRFDRLLKASSDPAGSEYQLIAMRLARCLGLRKAPEIMATAASISPMVWWIGGRVRIFVPRSMVARMDHAELCDILAHELGHVSRGDHYVRWLECLVCVVLWWNPVAWWARKNLRVCEEICCDAYVLNRTEASRDAYASALVSAMELLAVPTIRPSGLASHVNGGFIERRIRMILSGKSIMEMPRWVRGTVIVAAAVVAPLGFTLAQDDDDSLAKAEQWLESGVNSAYLTQEQADIMLRALRTSQFQMVRVLRRDGTEVDNIPRVTAVRIDPGARSMEQGLAFAERHFAERVDAGELTREEAEAILGDLRDAIESGQTEADGSVFYQRLFETGVIDEETAARRIEFIRQMEQDFNGPPAAVVIRDGFEGNVVRLDGVSGGEIDFDDVRIVDFTLEGDPQLPAPIHVVRDIEVVTTDQDE